MSWTVVEKVRRVVGEDVFLEAIEIVAGDLWVQLNKGTETAIG